MARDVFERKLRVEPRFRIRDDELVRVSVERVIGGASTYVTGTLDDISRGGFKVLLSEPLEFHKGVLLKLENNERDVQLSIAAHVCWMRPASGDRWLVGGRFVPRLPRDGFEQLTGGGSIERRASDRERAGNPVLTRWELERDTVGAVLWNLSQSGFCLLCPEPRQVGRRVVVFADGQRQRGKVLGRTVWTSKADEGYFVGCTRIAEDRIAFGTGH